ncbi:MAG: hypothetical protein GVY19_11405 [Bacteroidetes bacterium]|jgi:hypothetical protein|nr:hypothetical protein [Bacteroidota bacterium]
MKLLKIAFYVMISAGFMVVYSCQTAQQKDQQTQDDEIDMQEMDETEVKSEVEEIVYPLPSPFELTNMLNEMGARYEGEVLNAPENADKYITEKDKAVNLGVFAADLGYTVNYNKKQEANVFLKATKTLVDDLGITVDYSYLLQDENKEVARDKDSLVNIITKTYYDTYTFLNENNSPELAALMVAGFWTESMYIATHISEYTYDNTEIVKLMFEQRSSLEKLLGLLDDYKKSDHVAAMLPELKKIQEAYIQAGTSLTKEQLDIIKKSIANARKSIVS